MSVQQFRLRWNNHQPNFISMFTTLLNSGSLVDVTLAAEGQHLEAHRIVLSACSVYFQSLFTTNQSGHHPIVILKDVSYASLKIIVDFMYYGEINVSQEQLPEILQLATMLQIKGLTGMVETHIVTNNPDIALPSVVVDPETPPPMPNISSPYKKRRLSKMVIDSPSSENRSTIGKEFNGSAATGENSIALSNTSRQNTHFDNKDHDEHSAVDATIQQTLANRIKSEKMSKMESSQMGSEEIGTDYAIEEEPEQPPVINTTNRDQPSTSMAVTIIDRRGKTLTRQCRVRKDSETSTEPALIRRSSEPATAQTKHPELKKHASHPPMQKQGSSSSSFEAVYIQMATKTTPTTQSAPRTESSGTSEPKSAVEKVLKEASGNTRRASHCPVMRMGPALSCNFCWNTFDECGRILRRKTKYHCPECRSNLCIVPCFHEYHASLHERGEPCNN